MAKSKEPKDAPAANSLADILLKTLNEASTSTKAYALGDHAQHTWGIPIPCLAFQWLIGGSTVLPLQRYFSFSGITKSFKSTLNIEMGCWFVGAYRKLSPAAKVLFDAFLAKDKVSKVDVDPTLGVSDEVVAEVVPLMLGFFIYIDTESKTSGSMLDAMTWWRLNPEQLKHLLYKEVQSAEEWMKIVTSTIEFAQGLPEAPKGNRVPVLVSVDSLTGKASEDEQEKVMKEGVAEARGFPILVMQITNFFKRISLMGTTMSMAYVRHLKQSIDPNANGQMKEAGGSEAAFRTSISIRVTKGQGAAFASHPAMPFPQLSVEGYTLYLETNLSCVGPDKRRLPIDVLWQYVPQEDGSSKQLMLYNWDGALGQLLYDWKYDDKRKLYAADIERLNEVIYFVAGKKAKTVKCTAISETDLSFTEFGRAIEQTPELRYKVSRFLNIAEYPDVQVADIDRTPPKKKDADK